MEKIENVICSKEQLIHHFYCDKCNNYLGKSAEYDDGYYEQLGEFKLNFCLNGRWFTIKKCLCSKCNDKYLKIVENELIKLGFKNESN